MNLTLDAAGALVADVSAPGGGPKRDRQWTVRVTNPDQSSDDYEVPFVVQT